MKQIEYHKSFKKKYKQRVGGNKKLAEQIEKKIILFMTDRKASILKDHQLLGSMFPKRAFSVAHDLRIVYLELEEIFIFVDIGSHNQVY